MGIHCSVGFVRIHNYDNVGKEVQETIIDEILHLN
mgnify:CR=1 FL=1